MENEEKTITGAEAPVEDETEQTEPDAQQEPTDAEDSNGEETGTPDETPEEPEPGSVNDRYRLSLNSDVFNAMKADFDMSLRRLVATMEQKSSEDATLTVKLDVHLSNAGDQHIIPRFDHKVSTVLQLKDSRSGYTGGRDYELVWDKEANDYIMRPISDGQQSLFNNSAPVEQEEREDSEASPEDGEPGTWVGSDSEPDESAEKEDADELPGDWGESDDGDR